MCLRKELVVSLEDLRYVSIECPHCHAVVTLDMKERAPFAEKQGIFAPKTCPGCHTVYDSAITPAIDRFQKSYEALAPFAKLIAFRGEPVGVGEQSHG